MPISLERVDGYLIRAHEQGGYGEPSSFTAVLTLDGEVKGGRGKVTTRLKNEIVAAGKALGLAVWWTRRKRGVKVVRPRQPGADQAPFFNHQAEEISP